MNHLNRRAATAFLLALPLASRAAEAYPSKPIKVVIGYAAGGGTDLVGRLAAEQLRRLGVPIVVDNMPGAGQNIAANHVANSPNDGYTILMSAPALTINPWMYKATGYKPVDSFAPVALFGQAPNALVVSSKLNVRTVAELVNVLKAKGGNYSSAGFGTTHHLSAELFKELTGVKDVEHVPYKGAGEALNAVLAGEVQFAFVSVPSAKSLVGNDKVHILGLTGAHKSNLMPGVPMLSEAGLKGMDIGTWYGLLMPAGTPAAVVHKVNAALNQDSADFAARLAAVGVDYVKSSPEEFTAFIKADVVRWGRLLQHMSFEKQ